MKTALKRFGFDDSDPLDVWLNAAMHEFEDSADWSFLLDQATIAAVQGDTAIVVPSDFFKVMSIRYLGSTSWPKLAWWDPRQFDSDISDFTVQGIPDRYTTLGQSLLRFYPALNAAGSFLLTYESFLPDMVNDVDVPVIPVRYHYGGIVQGAAAIGLQAENEEERSANARAQFDATIGRATLKLSTETIDEAKAVRDVMGYGT